MAAGVYRIINEVNGKSYIGLSLDIETRIQTHFRDADRNYHSAIAKAISKYGKQNFSIEILYSLDKIYSIEEAKELLCKKEISTLRLKVPSV